MIVDGTLYGICTNYGTSVLGKTVARVLVGAKGHCFSLYGGYEIDRVVDAGGDTPNLEAASVIARQRQPEQSK